MSRSTRRSLILTDFSVGVDRRAEYAIPDGAAADASGIWGHKPGLLSMEGRRTVLTLNELNGPLGVIPTITRLFRFYKSGHAVNNTQRTTQNGWTVIYAENAAIPCGLVMVDVAAAGPKDFRPILATGTSPLWCPSGPITGLPNAAPHFSQASNRLYMCQPEGRPYRWSGNFYCVGTASCPGGGSFTVTGVGTSWLTMLGLSVHEGDAIFFWDTAAGRWNPTEYRINDVVGETDLRLRTAGPNTGGQVDYMIASTHPMGMDLPTPTAPAVQPFTLAAVVSGGGAMAAGTYRYCITHGNSDMATESNPTDPTAAWAEVTVGGGGTNAVDITFDIGVYDPADLQKNRLRIWRSLVSAAPPAQPPYYFNGVLNRVNPAPGVWQFAAVHTDGLADTSLDTSRTAEWDREPPGKLTQMKLWNNRMYGAIGPEAFARDGSLDCSRLYFSNLSEIEYWPVYTLDGTGPADVNKGGSVIVGQGREDSPLALAAGGGTFGSYGDRGTSLLVFTADKAMRWFGYDWTDFTLYDAFPIGCRAWRSVVNHRGMVYWLSSDGIMRTPADSDAPERVDLRLEDRWTWKTNDFQWSPAAAWKDWYIVSYPYQVGFHRCKGFAFHTPTGAIFPLDALGAYDFSVFRAGSDTGGLYYVSTDSDHAEGNVVYELFPDLALFGWGTSWYATGLPVRWKSKLYDLAAAPGELYPLKKVTAVTLAFWNPGVQQTFTLNVYGEGDTTPIYTQAAIAIPASATGRRQYVLVRPAVPLRRAYAFEITGNWTNQVRLEWMSVEHTAHAEAPGQVIG